MKLSRRARDRGGQSILEYLVIATVIVAAIIGIRSVVQTNINQLYNHAAEHTQDAANQLGGLNVELPQ